MDLSGKKVTVMGLGRFGGGVGVTRWLAQQGCDVLVTDMEPADKLADSVAEIQDLVDSGAVTLRLGEHNVSDFTTCDLVVANVAVPKPWDNRYICAAEAAKIPVTTEIALFLSRLPADVRERTIGITGSAGKSTTTAMIHHAIGAAAKGRGKDERVLLGGNIGVSLLSELSSIDDKTLLVLELSSAMLYWIARSFAPAPKGWSPHVAVVTNISPNHIDWHGEMDHYAASKQELLKSQCRGDSAILGSPVWDWRSLTPAAATRVDKAIFTREMRLPGDHNRENAAAALAACRAAMPDVPAEVFESAIASFGGLPHRLQLVAEVKRGAGEAIRFYNDSKSTTPESCLKAIEALASMPGFTPSRIHLIAGGYDKGSDLTPIAQAAGRLGGLYTIGKTGPKIASAVGVAGRTVDSQTLDRAFAAALEKMKPGDALLLSPGCASWDQFINYEKRGEAFIKMVEGLR